MNQHRTFLEWINEQQSDGVSTLAASSKSIQTESVGLKSAAAIAITARISQLHNQTMQDRSATNSEKRISTELFWLTSLVALGIAAAAEKK
jgi:hypothetical protein